MPAQVLRGGLCYRDGRAACSFSTARSGVLARDTGGKHPAAVPGGVLELRNADTGRGRGLSTPVCLIELPAAQRSLGPRITLSLPSFRCDGGVLCEG